MALGSLVSHYKLTQLLTVNAHANRNWLMQVRVGVWGGHQHPAQVWAQAIYCQETIEIVAVAPPRNRMSI